MTISIRIHDVVFLNDLKTPVSSTYPSPKDLYSLNSRYNPGSGLRDQTITITGGIKTSITRASACKTRFFTTTPFRWRDFKINKSLKIMQTLFLVMRDNTRISTSAEVMH
jgi:hypothetical protein